MTQELNTCDKCAHYIPAQDNDGECTLMGDINRRSNPIDSCSGWDVEGYGAGVYVGPKFGCIHWLKGV